jgi:lysophospholipase
MGRGAEYAPGQAADLVRRRVFEGNRVTSDRARFAVQARWFDEQPGLAVGGATWGWLDAALRSCRKLARREVLQRIGVPLLLAAAGRDIIVDNAAIRRAAAAIPGARLHRFPGSLHEILQERDDIRSAFWAAFDAFTAEGQGGSASR